MKKILLLIIILSFFFPKELFSQCLLLGSGTQSDPYQIWNEIDFRNRSHPDCRDGRPDVYYQMMQDIGTITFTFGDIPDWMHIDGGGHTINVEMAGATGVP